MPMIDVDAEHVKTYAKMHAGSDSDRGDPLEAGNEADTAEASNMAATATTNEPMNALAESLKRGEADSPVQPGSPKKQRVGDDQPTTPRDQGMILLVSEPRKHRGLRSPQINNECFK